MIPIAFNLGLVTPFLDLAAEEAGLGVQTNEGEDQIVCSCLLIPIILYCTGRLASIHPSLTVELPADDTSRNMPTEFHYLTQLPPELRGLIWEWALPEPRVFDIYPASTSQKTPAQQGLRFTNQLTEPPPALSGVCQESRSFILRHYSPLIISSTTKYIDFSRDILLLESCLLERGLLQILWSMSMIPRIRDNLCNLAFGISWNVTTGIRHPFLGRKPGESNAAKFLQRLALFPNLKRVIFVLDQEMQIEVRKLPQRTRVWDGHLNQNATLYLAGTKPPSVKAILSRIAPADSSLRPQAIIRPDVAALCNIPWTDEKPSLPHVNELLYYPVDLEEANDCVQVGEERHPNRCNGLWPTMVDFCQFKRELRCAVDMGVEQLLSRGSGGAERCEKRGLSMGSRGEEGEEALRKETWQRRGALPIDFKVPKMEGACLLWRFPLPAFEKSEYVQDVHIP